MNRAFLEKNCIGKIRLSNLIPVLLIFSFVVLLVPLMAQSQSVIPDCGESYMGPGNDKSGTFCKIHIKKGWIAKIYYQEWSEKNEEYRIPYVSPFIGFVDKSDSDYDKQRTIIIQERSDGIKGKLVINNQYDIDVYVSSPFTFQEENVGVCRFIDGREIGKCFRVFVEMIPPEGEDVTGTDSIDTPSTETPESEPTETDKPEDTKKEDQEEDPKEEHTCTDSDGGKNYFEKGTTISIYHSSGYLGDPKFEAIDGCVTSSVLREWYCTKDGNTKSVDVSCMRESSTGWGDCRGGVCWTITQQDIEGRLELIEEDRDRYRQFIEETQQEIQNMRNINSNWMSSVFGGKIDESEIMELESKVEFYKEQADELDFAAVVERAFLEGSRPWQN